MGNFDTLKATYDCQRGSLKSTLELNSDIKVALHHSHPGNGIAVQLTGKKWKAFYDLNSRNCEFERTFKSDDIEIKVAQFIPSGQWEVFPSPRVQLKKNFSKNDYKDELTLAYDTQSRKGSLHNSLKSGNMKFKVALDSKTGLEGGHASLGAKLDSSSIKSLAVHYDRAVGPTLVAKSRPSHGVRAKVAAELNSRNVAALVVLTPDSMKRTDLILETEFNALSPSKHAVKLGFKHKF